MITERYTLKSGVQVFHVEKIISDTTMNGLVNTFVKQSQIKQIIDQDTDVYDETGDLLLRFRTDKIPRKYTETFYNNVIKFAVTPTTNRGSATGSTSKSVKTNPKTMTNIIGYFDKLSPRQKWLHNKTRKNNEPLFSVRQTRFTTDFPEQYKKAVPLIQQIDKLYKKYAPVNYKAQKKKADQTHFKIDKTAFTTVTLNVNFQTTIHTDKGDDVNGFGNLAVIEHGEYDGGETCFPQYGIGVDVREGDILFMNVHQFHGNLPIKPKSKDAKRLSIVCYLREKVWEKSKNKSKKFMLNHIKTMKLMRKTNK